MMHLLLNPYILTHLAAARRTHQRSCASSAACRLKYISHRRCEVLSQDGCGCRPTPEQLEQEYRIGRLARLIRKDLLEIRAVVCRARFFFGRERLEGGAIGGELQPEESEQTKGVFYEWRLLPLKGCVRQMISHRRCQRRRTRNIYTDVNVFCW